MKVYFAQNEVYPQQKFVKVTDFQFLDIFSLFAIIYLFIYLFIYVVMLTKEKLGEHKGFDGKDINIQVTETRYKWTWLNSS